MEIHVSRDGETMGPYSVEEVKGYLAAGNLLATDLGWHEGADGWVPLNQIPALEMVDTSEPEPSFNVDVEFHHVSVLKFCVLSMCTFGLYPLYWFYKNWKYVRDRDVSDIMPFWRTVFAVIWTFELSNEVKRSSNGPIVAGVTLAPFLYLLANIGNRLPAPYDWVGLFAFVPLIPLVVQIDRINREQGTGSPSYARFGVGSIIACVLGLPLLALALIGSSIFTVPENVVAGDDMRAKDVAFLERQGILEPGEHALYFYSLGFFSVEGDGNLLTDRRVVSYYEDLFDGELVIDSATFDEIADIDVLYSDSMLEDTEIYIQLNENDVDNGFYLYVSSGEDGDELFVNQLMTLWQMAKAQRMRESSVAEPPSMDQSESR